ncbi:MAG TPA: hypothetical protein VF222_13100 [Nitrososphaeraceae archaeon]
MQICGYVQGALYQTSNNYVEDDGDLTRDGETALVVQEMELYLEGDL